MGSTETAGPGHNSGSYAPGQLRSIVERIERLEEEKQNLGDDIRDVFKEARGVGFDPRILKKLIALRKIDPEKRAQDEAILDLYKTAVGTD